MCPQKRSYDSAPGCRERPVLRAELWTSSVPSWTTTVNPQRAMGRIPISQCLECLNGVCDNLGKMAQGGYKMLPLQSRVGWEKKIEISGQRWVTDNSRAEFSIVVVQPDGGGSGA